MRVHVCGYAAGTVATGSQASAAFAASDVSGEHGGGGWGGWGNGDMPPSLPAAAEAAPRHCLRKCMCERARACALA